MFVGKMFHMIPVAVYVYYNLIVTGYFHIIFTKLKAQSGKMKSAIATRTMSLLT